MFYQQRECVLATLKFIFSCVQGAVYMSKGPNECLRGMRSEVNDSFVSQALSALGLETESHPYAGVWEGWPGIPRGLLGCFLQIVSKVGGRVRGSK